MRTIEQLIEQYENDIDFKNFMKNHKKDLAVYILLSHLDDNLKMINNKLEDLNSLLDGSN